MATTAFEGGQLKLYKVTTGSPDTETLISMQVTTSFSLSRAAIDITNKDGNDWEESIPGLKSGTLDLTARIDTAPATGKMGIEDTFALFDSGAVTRWRLKGTVGGDEVKLDFEGWVESHDLTLDNQAAADVSLTIHVTGAVSITID
ncbi:phage tail tube protein [Larkinella soli]|uniref:phage tail tube protein n=1 Tax=Larkinella soli TaxID=1770527 RepID=UPI000FFCBFE0|nr:phage tail tube protein [Larkinella soli]